MAAVTGVVAVSGVAAVFGVAVVSGMTVVSGSSSFAMMASKAGGDMMGKTLWPPGARGGAAGGNKAHIPHSFGNSRPTYVGGVVGGSEGGREGGWK